MKKIIAASCTVLVLLGQAGGLQAQDASGAASAASSAASSASSSPSTFAGLIAAAFKELKALKAKCCNDCPSGQIIKALTKQLNVATGGLICPGCCPDNPNPDNKPSTSAAGACAKIQEDAKGMKKRRDAVKCLAYVDCHWWPEAEAALINALRTDKNECVRLEAALVLQRGCCCTKKVIEALKIVVEGSNKDGNPSENSERVRDAAMGALQHCMYVYHDEAPATRPEAPPAAPPPAGAAPPAGTAKISDALPWYAYYEQVDKQPMSDILANARRTLAVSQAVVASQNQHDSNERYFVPTGKRNLYEIWSNAAATASDATNEAARTAPVPQRPVQAVGRPAPRPAPPLAPEYAPVASARGQSPHQVVVPQYQPAPVVPQQPSAPRATISFEEVR